jgi:hypothetical protein
MAAVVFRVARLPFNQVETTMDITTLIEGRILTVQGTTSLADGALIDCETWHESEDDGIGPLKYATSVEAVVKSGTFVCRADLTGWPSGTVRADASFIPYEEGQPADVIDRYGEYGEHLSGTGVFQDSDGWILHARKNVPLAGIESPIGARDAMFSAARIA